MKKFGIKVKQRGTHYLNITNSPYINLTGLSLSVLIIHHEPYWTDMGGGGGGGGGGGEIYFIQRGIFFPPQYTQAPLYHGSLVPFIFST